MLLLQGRISPAKQSMTLCVIGRVRLERNCGKMYSRHLFPYGGFPRLFQPVQQAFRCGSEYKSGEGMEEERKETLAVQTNPGIKMCKKKGRLLYKSYKSQSLSYPLFYLIVLKVIATNPSLKIVVVIFGHNFQSYSLQNRPSRSCILITRPARPNNRVEFRSVYGLLNNNSQMPT